MDGLNVPALTPVVRKGFRPTVDSYSAFFEIDRCVDSIILSQQSACTQIPVDRRSSDSRICFATCRVQASNRDREVTTNLFRRCTPTGLEDEIWKLREKVLRRNRKKALSCGLPSSQSSPATSTVPAAQSVIRPLKVRLFIAGVALNGSKSY